MARQGFSFLASPDSALIRQELERQVSGWKEATSPRRLVFWGDEEPGDAFWDGLNQSGLFGEKRVLVVRQAENWSADVWKQISAALAREHEHVWPFFCLEVEVEKGRLKIPAHIQKQRCFTFADKKSWVWRNPGLGSSLQRFVREQAKSLGLAFKPDDLTLFCDSCPRDAHGIICELRKLSLLSKDGQIKSDWLQGGDLSLEQDAFKLIRQISSGDLSGAWRAISSDSEGALLFFVIAMLSREFRILWQITAGEMPRLHPAEAGKKKAVAHMLGPDGISRGFSTLADAEWRVKSGRQTPAQALESLAVTMTSIFNQA